MCYNNTILEKAVPKKKKKKKKKHKRHNTPNRVAASAKTELSHQNVRGQPPLDRQDIKPLSQERLQNPLPVENVERSWTWWITGWRLFVELATVFGLAIALYTLRPVLAVNSLAPSDLHGNNGSKASITVTGTGIKDVTVQCVTNKVIFEGINTLALPRFTILDEYSVRDVAVGESFTADCNFAWSLWTKVEGGYFLMGEGTPGTPQLGIPFVLNKDGMPSLRPGAPFPAIVKPNLVGHFPSQVTSVDGYFIVLYRWPLSPFREKRTIHMIARRNSGGLQWRVAPSSEPIIADAPGGFIVTASAEPDKWGVTMKRTGPN